MTDPQNIFIPLLNSPIFGLTLTIGSFLIGQKIYQLSGRFAPCHPVVIAVLFVTLFLEILGINYDDYRNSTEILNILLGTATVALAVPLYQQMHLVKTHAKALLITLIAGAVFAPAIALFIAWLCGANETTLLSLVSKSVTTPIAIAITENIGGLPAIAAGTVIIVGIFGAAVGLPIMNRLKIHNKAVRGFTLGLTSHAVGTAKAFELDPVTGAFASLGLALTGAITALATPIIWHAIQTL